MLVPSLEERVTALEADIEALRTETRAWAGVAVIADRKCAGLGDLLNPIYRDLAAIRETLAHHSERFVAVEGRLSRVEVDLTDVKARLTRVEDRLEKLEGRLEGLEGRLEGLEGRLEGLEGRLGDMDGKLDLILDRLAA